MREENAGRTVELEDLEWEHRPLFIFAPSTDTESYQDQAQGLQGRKTGLRDRDMVVFRVVSEGQSRVDGRELNRADETYLRQRFDVDTGQFAVILVGKDGTVKMRCDGPVKMDEIFDRIDSMPMRKREMKEEEDGQNN